LTIIIIVIMSSFAAQFEQLLAADVTDCAFLFACLLTAGVTMDQT